MREIIFWTPATTAQFLGTRILIRITKDPPGGEFSWGTENPGFYPVHPRKLEPVPEGVQGGGRSERTEPVPPEAFLAGITEEARSYRKNEGFARQ